jgi:hypothetical protein
MGGSAGRSPEASAEEPPDAGHLGAVSLPPMCGRPVVQAPAARAHAHQPLPRLLRVRSGVGDGQGVDPAQRAVPSRSHHRPTSSLRINQQRERQYTVQCFLNN